MKTSTFLYAKERRLQVIMLKDGDNDAIYDYVIYLLYKNHFKKYISVFIIHVVQI